MDLNPEARNEICDALAAVMRGELSSEEFQARTCTIRHIHPRLKHEDADAFEWLSVIDKAGSPAHTDLCLVDEHWWSYLLRVLAFLRSDFVTVRRRETVCPARWRALVVALVLFALWSFGAYRLLGCNAGSYVVAWLLPAIPFFAMARRRRRPDSASRVNEFFPFESESQWLASQPLLDTFKLPAFEQVRRERVPPRKRSWLLRLPLAIAGWSLGGLALTLIIACTLAVLAVILPFVAIWNALGPLWKNTSVVISAGGLR